MCNMFSRKLRCCKNTNIKHIKTEAGFQPLSEYIITYKLINILMVYNFVGTCLTGSDTSRINLTQWHA